MQEDNVEAAEMELDASENGAKDVDEIDHLAQVIGAADVPYFVKPVYDSGSEDDEIRSARDKFKQWADSQVDEGDNNFQLLVNSRVNEDEYDGKLHSMVEDGTVIYHGMIKNVAEFMSEMHVIIHPSYYPEGMSNVLLEACATGRPIITTDRSGCKEIVNDGINGYMIPCQDSKALASAINRFMELNYGERKEMGYNARKKVEKQFDRDIVVRYYMEEVANV